VGGQEIEPQIYLDVMGRPEKSRGGSVQTYDEDVMLNGTYNVTMTWRKERAKELFDVVKTKLGARPT